ncbi:hypothetical protein GPALN_005460 [Globodera pallida]|nr:hypothetical protein GPALN_005460 [Globodera pallida]
MSLIRREIQQFAAFANVFEWFDELNGIFRPLHTFNQIRIPWISEYLTSPSLNAAQPLFGKRILDIGCGAGILSASLCRRGALVTGLDTDESVLGIAQKYKKTLAPNLRNKIEFVSGTIERFAEEKNAVGTFDAVVASEVLEHVSDLPLFIRSCCKLARPNSPLFFTTINRTIWSQLLAKTIAEDVLRILPQGLHQFEQFVTPQELLKMLLDEQCNVGPVLGLFYNPMLNKWNWTRFTDVNYALVAYTGK